jgi:Tol biopolymer transport system component
MRSAGVAIAVGLLALGTGGASSAAARAQLQIGFVRNGSIWLASPTGRQAHVVVRSKSPYSYLEPAWSRGGSLAVTEYEDTYPHGYSAVAIIRPKRRTLRISHGIFAGRAAWSPNGKLVVFVDYNYGTPPGGTLEIANLSTRRSIPISEGGGSPLDIDDEPAWSPDGRTIAYTRPEIDDDYNYVASHLFAVRANGKETRQITASPASNPTWSPGGDSIAFDNDHQIFVIRADGTGERRLTAGTHDSEPAWSPNGRQIAFQRRSSIWVMNADGSRAHRVLRNAAQPAWK